MLHRPPPLDHCIITWLGRRVMCHAMIQQVTHVALHLRRCRWCSRRRGRWWAGCPLSDASPSCSWRKGAGTATHRRQDLQRYTQNSSRCSLGKHWGPYSPGASCTKLAYAQKKLRKQLFTQTTGCTKTDFAWLSTQTSGLAYAHFCLVVSWRHTEAMQRNNIRQTHHESWTNIAIWG